MENVILNVQGMSCGHCAKTIEGSVGELNGIVKVKVFLEKGSVEVEFNPEKVALEKIKEAIELQGYDVK
ncbi:copper chaperone CopZ [Niallia sp.]|uniref:copper chaperone CopZ n=1 Tax=Niallia sp. TaxID=2837523 RepID=UPI00289843D2|nr:copper chaperone CopZ [Niallia sp.]